MRSILIPIRRLVHRATQVGLHIERRFEPFFRRRLNALVRDPLARLIQRLKNQKTRRPWSGVGGREDI